MVRDSHSVAPLLEALEHASPAEKLYIIDALGPFGDASVIPALLDLYEKDTTTELREMIIDALDKLYATGHIEDVTFLPILRDALNTPVATSAARMLLNIGSDETTQVLTKALLSLSELQCKTLVQAIKPCNMNKFIASLEETYNMYTLNSNIYDLHILSLKEVNLVKRVTPQRRRIIWLLGCLENNNAIPTLIQAIDDPDKMVMYEAVRAMKRLGSERSRPALETILKRHAEGFDDPTLMLAVQALAQISNMHSVLELQSFLLAMLNKRNIELSVQAIEALGKLGDYDTIGYLRSMDLKAEIHELKPRTEYLEIRNAIEQAIKEIRTRLTA
jgi:HEAT repeat protein